MKKRKWQIALFAVIPVLLTLVLIAARPVGKEYGIRVVADGETVLNKEYRKNFFVAAKVALLYGGSYEKLSQNEYSGDDKELIRSLNLDLYEDIEKLVDSNTVMPTDAQVEFVDGGFVYHEAKEGYRVDREKLFADVVSSLQSGEEIGLSVSAVKPSVDVDGLKKNTRLMSTFTTTVSGSENRKKNIALAATKINGAVIGQNDYLSFNERVGERSEANGFLMAHVIKDGEFVDGVGGGVCQASTTLYNAWLRAGLAVLSASAHSLPVSYVPASLDAMVSSTSDLVLHNDSPRPIYVRAWYADNKMTVELYGRPSEYEIRLRSVNIKRLEADYEISDEDVDWQENETVRIIKRAKDGLISESYRDFLCDGTVVRTERLRRNEYKPQNGVKIIRSDAEKSVKNATDNQLAL